MNFINLSLNFYQKHFTYIAFNCLFASIILLIQRGQTSKLDYRLFNFTTKYPTLNFSQLSTLVGLGFSALAIVMDYKNSSFEVKAMLLNLAVISLEVSFFENFTEDQPSKDTYTIQEKHLAKLIAQEILQAQAEKEHQKNKMIPKMRKFLSEAKQNIVAEFNKCEDKSNTDLQRLVVKHINNFRNNTKFESKIESHLSHVIKFEWAVENKTINITIAKGDKLNTQKSQILMPFDTFAEGVNNGLAPQNYASNTCIINNNTFYK